MTGELLALVALVRRPRVSMVLLLGLFNGMGVATHNLALLAAPAYAVAVMVLVLRRRVGWYAAPLFAAAWCAGAAPIIWLTIQMTGQAERQRPSGRRCSGGVGRGRCWADRQRRLSWTGIHHLQLSQPRPSTGGFGAVAASAGAWRRPGRCDGVHPCDTLRLRRSIHRARPVHVFRSVLPDSCAAGGFGTCAPVRKSATMDENRCDGLAGVRAGNLCDSAVRRQCDETAASRRWADITVPKTMPATG